MGEEVEIKDYPELDKDRVLEWEDGLPSTNDLTPLSHALISPELASAFSITPEPSRTMIDVNRASQTTFSNLRKQNQGCLISKFKPLPSFQEIDPVIVEGYEPESEENEEKDGSGSGSEKRKLQTLDNTEEPFQTENSNEDNTTRALKRPRLVWTPQLHKRFVEVVAHLGIKNAVPKTIMQLMNVEGLTRENVASHLQKYRLYLKRMQGLSDEGPSPSDQLFASTPVPPSLNESAGAAAPVPTMPVPVPVPMPYGHPLMPMPVLGMPHGGSHMGMPSNVGYHGFNPHHYNMYREQQRDWSGNRFGSVMSQHHVSHHTK